MSTKKLNKTQELEKVIRGLTPAKIRSMSTKDLMNLGRQAQKYVNKTIQNLKKADLATRATTGGLNESHKQIKRKADTQARRQAVSAIKRAKKMAMNPLRTPSRIKKLTEEAVAKYGKDNFKWVLGKDGKPELVLKSSNKQVWSSKTFKKFDEFKKYMKKHYDYDSEQSWEAFIEIPADEDPIKYMESKIEEEINEEREMREKLFGQKGEDL